MKKLAIIVTRGGYNTVLHVCELVKIAASHDGTQVSVFFRDESVAKMTLDKAKPLTFTEGYRGREARMREYLEEQKKDDLQGLLREAKESGDVKFSICRDSIKYFGHKVEDLLPEFDEVQSLEAFWKEEILTAEQVLTF